MATLSKQTEVPWVDAWIRWERNSKQHNDIDEPVIDDDEDDDLPPPTEHYHFTYTTACNRSITLKLEGYHADSEQIWNSTGLTLWRSSYYLCHYLVDHWDDMMVRMDGTKNNSDDESLRILEVGSGLGRCGMLAHLLSTVNGINTRTILTDGDTDTLKQLRQNVKKNIQEGSIECRQLLWGRDYAMEFLQRMDKSDDKFDLIIGSDLLYVTSVIRPLFETVFELLKVNKGKFLMAHCCRRVGNEVSLEQVLHEACQIGFEWRELVRHDEDIVLLSFWLKE